MTRSHVDFLKDIIAYSEKAIATVSTHPPEAFHRFSDVGMVLMLSLEIVGEAVKNISVEIKKKYPYVGWKQAAAMRDILSHQYWRTDFSIIIDTVKDDLPHFLNDIRQVLQDLGED
ncbi:MAG: HepT-like ribonuclease domain-containing protein [Saprospiraceae bacterium]|nr:HepT-like ribonuclease domain-containing protein [Saprospiraceae bacterium]